MNTLSHAETGEAFPVVPFSFSQAFHPGFCHSASVQHLAWALVQAQGAMQNVKAQEIGESGNKNYRYADLAAVLGMSRQHLLENGLAVLQLPETEISKVRMTTLLLHGPSGEWFAWTLSLPVFDSHPQTYGALFTYARRYMLNGLLNIAAEQDDDGRGPARRACPQAGGVRVPQELGEHPARNGFNIDSSAGERNFSEQLRTGSADPGRCARMPNTRSKRRSERHPQRILASHLYRHFGARTPQEFSLLITTACDDPLLTWNVVRSRSDLVDKILHEIEVWRVRQGWAKEEVLQRLKNVPPAQFVEKLTTEDPPPLSRSPLAPHQVSLSGEEEFPRGMGWEQAAAEVSV